MSTTWRVMSKFLLAFSMLPWVALADAPELGEAKTKSGYIFCQSYSDWNHFTNLLASGDPAAREKFDAEPNCGLLADGITVYVNERMDSLFAVKVSFDGETFFTDIKALNPAKPTPKGMWAVQLASFSNQENAERLAANLRNQGYAVFVSQLQTGSGALHRVRIGPQKNRESAEEVAKQLSAGGHKGQIVQYP
jgi:hypothetical protein